MKTHLFIILTALLILNSCSGSDKAKSVANKAIKELGSGKYYNKFGLTYDLFYGEGSVFSQAEADDIAARTESHNSNFSTYIINTNLLFSEYELSSIKKREIDLHSFSTKPIEDKEYYDSSFSYEDKLEIYEICKDYDKKNAESNEYKLCFDDNNTEIGYSYLRYKNVTLYELRYKIDNKYLAEMHVINLPDEGYKVTMFKLVK